MKNYEPTRLLQDRCVPRFAGGRSVGCPEHSTGGHTYLGGLVGGHLIFACGCIGSYHYPHTCDDRADFDPWGWCRPKGPQRDEGQAGGERGG